MELVMGLTLIVCLNNRKTRETTVRERNPKGQCVKSSDKAQQLLVKFVMVDGYGTRYSKTIIMLTSNILVLISL